MPGMPDGQSSYDRANADMSAASNLRFQDNFLCSICGNVFTDPVTTSCGHNFCNNCIIQHWDRNQTCQCPKCKEPFNTRPQLSVNTFISRMVAQFRHELDKTKAKIQQMIKKRRLKIKEIKESVKTSKGAAYRQKAEGVQVFTGLKESVERRLTELIEEIEGKQETTEKQAEGLIKDLEQEISELKEISSEVEQLLRTEDHLHLLQRLSVMKVAPPTKDWTEVRFCPPSYERTVFRAVAQLEETVWKDMKKKLSKAELKIVQQYAVDVTLDPDTAHPDLILSDDRKQVYDSDVEKNLPDNPERFSKGSNILGEQSFSSGKFYFEVQVKGKTDWDLGVASESINRKRKTTLSPKNGFWTVWLRDGNEYEACASPPVPLSLQPGPEKVGVFVDYEKGLVSFYDVGTAALIYSFTGCSFTHKLHPFFSPCSNNRGKNSAPLIICPVDQTESIND
ncbi:zinc-binding protein A33-like [Simochromis diagramma]|uniref:zinc-binding protein A33-like n=1 Tax=Simochromis diagramma TaxID=43689 RepID=UPI001A7EA28F|nr:zinc-binding protein A33-like [Simochromis diagramma]